MKLFLTIVQILVFSWFAQAQMSDFPSYSSQLTILEMNEDPNEERTRRLNPNTIFYTGLGVHALANGFTSLAIMNSSTAKGAIGNFLLFSGGTAGIMAIATRNDYKTFAMARAYNSGVFRGSVKGLLLASDILKSKDFSDGAIQGAGFLAFLSINAESVLMYQYSKLQELSPKEVHSMIRFSDISLLSSLAITSRLNKGKLLFDLDGDDDELSGPRSTSARFYPSVLASYGGYLLGRQYMKKFDRTFGDISYMFNNYLLFGATAQFLSKRPRTSTLTSEAIIASLGGVALGHLLTQNTKLSLSQNAGINAVSYGAGALTYLASYLFDGGNEFRGSEYIKVAGLTAIVSNLLMRERAKKKNTGSNIFSNSKSF